MKTKTIEKVAVCFGKTHVAVPISGYCTISGIELVRHKSLGKAGWSLTDPRSGIALVTGFKGTAAAVAVEAKSRIDRNDPVKVLAQIAALDPAPPVDTLPDYVKPAPQAPTINVDAICIELAARSGVDEKIIRRVICSKGKNAGRLLGKCPSIWNDKEAAAVWLGLQPNPFKVSVGKVLFLGRELQELVSKLSATKWPSWLDSDRAKLEGFGVW